MADDFKKYYNFILAFSGPYGAGASSLVTEMEKMINDLAGCKAIRIKVSDIIKSYYPQVTKKELNLNLSGAPFLRESLQTAGNEIRRKDNGLLGKIIALEINKQGIAFEKHKNKNSESDIHAVFFLIDSLKNTNDFKSLKSIFTEELFLIFVHANPDVRWNRMTRYKKWEQNHRSKFFELDMIDNSEKSIKPEIGNAGQEVGKICYLSDYFIVNNFKDRDELIKQGQRFVEMLLGTSKNQPSFHERAMHLAFSASNRSYCLSRQVGAAIFDHNGNILGVGHNDVPKAGGGLYNQESSPEDKRCYKVGDRRCINDLEKEKRFESLFSKLIKTYSDSIEDPQKKDCINEQIKSEIQRSDFRELTEYCRAVHAEMEALLSVGRVGSHSTEGAIMYVTTQPCHNCTKHILCAGIDKVYFIEPYPKSLAGKLHGDSIVIDPVNPCKDEKMLELLPYEGISPKRFHDFFAIHDFEERKNNDGYAIIRNIIDRAKKPRFSNKINARSRIDEKNMDTKLVAEFENSSYIGTNFLETGGDTDEERPSKQQ